MIGLTDDSRVSAESKEVRVDSRDGHSFNQLIILEIVYYKLIGQSREKNTGASLTGSESFPSGLESPSCAAPPKEMKAARRAG
jgi:hypothetical protein